MRKIYVLDRVECGIATVICDDGRVLDVAADALGDMSERDVFSAIEINGELTCVVRMPDETESRLMMARKMLDKLKQNNKKQN